MSDKWQWVIGWVGIAAATLAIPFFLVTQTVTWRDASSAFIGLVIGATFVACIATLVFHRDNRNNRKAAEIAAARATAEGEIANAKTAADAAAARLKDAAGAELAVVRLRAAGDVEAIRVRAEAEADAIRTTAGQVP